MGLLDNLGLGGLVGTPTGFGSQQGYGLAQSQQPYNPAAQQAGLYNQHLSRGMLKPPDWVFDGVTYSSRDFADAVWPEDCAAKTAFVLKYVK